MLFRSVLQGTSDDADKRAWERELTERAEQVDVDAAQDVAQNFAVSAMQVLLWQAGAPR